MSSLPLNDGLRTMPRSGLDHGMDVIVHYQVASQPLPIAIVVQRRGNRAALCRIELRLLSLGRPHCEEVCRALHPELRQVFSIEAKRAFLHRAPGAGETPAATSGFFAAQPLKHFRARICARRPFIALGLLGYAYALMARDGKLKCRARDIKNMSVKEKKPATRIPADLSTALKRLGVSVRRRPALHVLLSRESTRSPAGKLSENYRG